MIYDISPAIRPDLAVWPGDTRPSREVLLDMGKGDNLTLSTLHATVHLGAHTDAPSHYTQDGASMGEVVLDVYVGECQVLGRREEGGGRGTRVEMGELLAVPDSQRVLIKTGTYPDPYNFNEDFAGLSPSLIDELGARGVKLVGIDTPSVDLFSSKDLPAHRACARNGIYILEGIVLSDVPSGHYELIALPLKLDGFDASPVRAVLLGEGGGGRGEEGA